MLFGNRRPRHSDARRRGRDIVRPRGEALEDRTLLSIDLGGTVPQTNPNIANAPYGMDFALASTSSTLTPVINAGSGWSVSDLGDLTGNGYDDFAIGAPTITNPSTLGSGTEGSVYIVFGSQSVNSTTITDWIGKTASGTYQYTANDRVGNIGMPTSSTNPNQTNPITNTQLTFPFPYVQLILGSQLISGLGASVSSVRMSNGTYGVLVGAPFATDANDANQGTGRAYLISGNLYGQVGSQILLDSATPPTGVNIVTFDSTATGGQLGYSVAGGYNIFGDNAGDVILGAPNATVGTLGGTGAVYAVSTAALTGTTQTINVTTLGQSGNNSAIFAGATAGSQAGWSVADSGDVNGVTSGGTNVDDLLIGAPAQSGGGAAYLIYGGSTLASLAQTINNVRYISLANVGAASTTTGAIPGATILGPSGSRTGYAVSSGGSFDGNITNSDVLIGSPMYSNGTLTNNGLATLLYGASSTAAGYLTGTITLTSPPSGVTPLYMQGAMSSALAGYSVSPVGYINAGQPSLILVGSPGFNSNSGAAYLIPGRAGGLTGNQSLSAAESAPLSGIQFLLTTPNVATTSPPFFGASVSSRFQTTSVTADGDSMEDFIIGAPGYSILQNSTTSQAGGAMVIQGGLITVPVPGVSAITTTIGVGTPFAPYSINATTPANLQIYVFGTTTSSGQTFEPVRDIDPSSVTVNGVTFTNVTLTPDPNTADWVNGIQDAILTITPRSSLRLSNGTQTFTVSGKILTTSPLAGDTWAGSASVTVTGGTSGGGGGGSSLLAVAASGPVTATTYNSPFGADQFVPTIAQLSAYNYAPIPLTVAIQQYLPAAGFNERLYSYNNRGKHLKNYLTLRGPASTGIFEQKNSRILLSAKVYDRSRFHPGKPVTYTHKAPNIGSIYKGVIPVQQTTQSAMYLGPVYADSNRDIGSKLPQSLTGGSGTGIHR